MAVDATEDRRDAAGPERALVRGPVGSLVRPLWRVRHPLLAATLTAAMLFPFLWSPSRGGAPVDEPPTTHDDVVVVTAAAHRAGERRHAPHAARGRAPVRHVVTTRVASASFHTTAAVATSTVAHLPGVALAAYQRAAQVLDAAEPRCGISWTLLAAVGEVESHHGSLRGSRLDDEGREVPALLGPMLDGSHGYAAVRDTDAGELDRSRRWDRAVGPMQVLPATWRVVAVDGDGDGVRGPQDIDDAALAAGVYLCAGHRRLDTARAIRRAAMRYDDSRRYARLVVHYDRVYRNLPKPDALSPQDLVTVTVPPIPETWAPQRLATHVAGRHRARSGPPAARHHRHHRHDRHHGEHRSTGRHRAPDTSPHAATSPKAPVVSSPATAAKAPVPAETAETPKPAPTPTPTPIPTPTPTPTPAPPPTPVTTTLSGTWTGCAAGYCLGSTPLTVPVASSTTAPADVDEDGAVESWGQELAGLDGHTVRVTVRRMGGTTTVLAVNGTALG